MERGEVAQCLCAAGATAAGVVCPAPVSRRVDHALTVCHHVMVAALMLPIGARMA